MTEFDCIFSTSFPFNIPATSTPATPEIKSDSVRGPRASRSAQTATSHCRLLQQFGNPSALHADLDSSCLRLQVSPATNPCYLRHGGIWKQRADKGFSFLQALSHVACLLGYNVMADFALESWISTHADGMAWYLYESG